MPQPQRPPFFIGGNPSITIPRAIRRGDGWIPVGILPSDLKPLVANLQQAVAAGRGLLEVIAMKTLPLDDRAAAVELAQVYRDAGATRLVHTQSYSSPAHYQELADILTQEIQPTVR